MLYTVVSSWMPRTSITLSCQALNKDANINDSHPPRAVHCMCFQAKPSELKFSMLFTLHESARFLRARTSALQGLRKSTTTVTSIMCSTTCICWV